MGKLKRGRRGQGARHNPVARRNGGTNTTKDENTRQNKIVPLIARLTLTSPNDRSMALSTITVLAEDSRMRRMLLKERLVASVLQLLDDSNDEIVVEAFGLLRNLTIEEGHEVAKFLWRNKIWDAVEKGLDKLEGSLQFLEDNKTLEKKRAYLLYDFTENLLSLVVAIASCSEELYLNVYSRIEKVVRLVVELLNWNMPKLRTTVKLFNSLLDFVYEFASDSEDFIGNLNAYPAFSLPDLAAAVATPAHEKNTLGKVYVLGIQFHFMEVGNGEKKFGEILKNVFQIVTAVDIEQVAVHLQHSAVPKPDQTEKPQDIDVAFGGDSPEKIQAKSDLQAIEVAIDLFTTICEYLAMSESDLAPVHLFGDWVSIILELAYPACLHLLEFDLGYSGCLQLTLKVLIALNNMCWLFLSCDSIPTMFYEKIPHLWTTLEKVAQHDSLESLRLCLNVFWALSKMVGPEIKDKISAESVSALLAKCTEVTALLLPDVQLASLEFILAAVGFLGTVAQVIGSVDATRDISEFLLGQIGFFVQEETFRKEPAAVEIVVESLNAVYDVFGDAEYDYDYPVFVEGNYLGRLAELEPRVKALYKQIDKNKHGELKVKTEEAWTNLGRFIEYKNGERA